MYMAPIFRDLYSQMFWNGFLDEDMRLDEICLDKEEMHSRHKSLTKKSAYMLYVDQGPSESRDRIR